MVYNFIPEAIKRGATNIVLEQNVILPTSIEQVIQENRVNIKRVDNTRLTLAQMSTRALDIPLGICKLLVLLAQGKNNHNFFT